MPLSARNALTVFHRRIVGATELPKSLTDLDVEVLLRLSAQDVDAIRSRFRGDGRVGAALLPALFVPVANRWLVSPECSGSCQLDIFARTLDGSRIPRKRTEPVEVDQHS